MSTSTLNREFTAPQTHTAPGFGMPMCGRAFTGSVAFQGTGLSSYAAVSGITAGVRVRGDVADLAKTTQIPGTFAWSPPDC